MLISLSASAAVLLAMFLFLATFLMTGAFAGRVPSGSDAMGLVVPLMCSAVAAALLMLAAGLCAFNGKFDWSGRHPATVALLVSAGLGAAAIGVLIAWMEKMGAWVIPAGIVAGALAPLAAGALVLLCAWWPAARAVPAGFRLWFGLPLGAVASFGAALALWGALAFVRDEKVNAQRIAATDAAEDAEYERRAALSPVERLREDYAQMSDSSPLWVFTAGLPDVDAADEREFIIARAMKVPEFERDLAANLATDHPRYRHGAVDLIRFVPADQLRPEWAGMLARAIDTTAGEIALHPDWFTPDEFSNPDPAGHVRAMRAAADRLGGGDALDAAWARLRAAIDKLPDDKRPDGLD